VSIKVHRIGIYLFTKPEEGGTYQYTLTMIKALASPEFEKYNITAFYHDEKWNEILPGKYTKVRYQRSLLRRLLSKTYKSIDRSIDGYRRFSGYFNPIVNLVNQSACEVMIYPNQDALSYQTKKKSLVTIHDLMHCYEPQYEEYQHGYYKIRERHFKNICRYSSGVLVDSEIGKQQVHESYGKNLEEIFVLPFIAPYYLFESKFIDVKNKYKLPNKFLFYPAQFWQHKNHENLLQALKILKDQGTTLHLVLVGSKKNYYTKIVSLIETLNLENDVTILGYVSNDEIYSFYKEAFALTFVSLLGPTNIPPLEAMLLGCPVIISNKYAMPEQVGNAGLLVNPLDPQDIAHTIGLIYRDEKKRQQLIALGIQKSNSWKQEDFNSMLHKIIMALLKKNY
jgi:glycosyltransferase involved in cell wall biosynthesis